jgi:hypothetical protein
VFAAGARFKALAVRVPDGDGPGDDEDERPSAPRVAVLVRELAPAEPHSGEELDARDLAVLPKLERALDQRWSSATRLLDDPWAVARLTSPLLEVRPERAARPAPAPGQLVAAAPS